MQRIREIHDLREISVSQAAMGTVTTGRLRLPDQLQQALRSRHYSRRTEHACRHYFVTHLIEADYDIWTIQELMGYKDVGDRST